MRVTTKYNIGDELYGYNTHSSLDAVDPRIVKIEIIGILILPYEISKYSNGIKKVTHIDKIHYSFKFDHLRNFENELIENLILKEDIDDYFSLTKENIKKKIKSYHYWERKRDRNNEW